MEVSNIKKLRESIKDFDDDQPIIFQVVGAESGAWNMYPASINKMPGNNNMVLLTLRHPDLKNLQMDWD